jgi:hypothetical protein
VNAPVEQIIDAHLGRNESFHPEEIATLTRADRCDTGCTAAAVVATLIPYTHGGTGLLMWCDHHYRQHKDALVEIAGAIRDERHLLEER